MNIENNTLSKLEKLAKLHIDETNKKITLNKIQGILEIMDKINLEDIKDLEPLYHPLQISQIMREDIADSNIKRDYIQKQSPQVVDGLFLVPKVID